MTGEHRQINKIRAEIINLISVKSMNMESIDEIVCRTR